MMVSIDHFVFEESVCVLEELESPVELVQPDANTTKTNIAIIPSNSILFIFMI